MEIKVNITGSNALVTIDGNIDSTSGIELDEKFQEIIGNTNIKNVNFDLKAVKSINSAGIGKILKFYKHYDSMGGSFKIIHVSEKLMSLFKDINLDKIISISE